MAEEGLIDGKKTAFHRMGGVPKVTVLRVVDIDDGEASRFPTRGSPTTAPRRRGCGWSRASATPRLRVGDRVLARTEETGRGWTAHPMKKLPARGEGLLGRGRARRQRQALARADRQARAHSSPIADLGGAEPASWCSPSRAARRARA
jgi:ribonuclease R